MALKGDANDWKTIKTQMLEHLDKRRPFFEELMGKENVDELAVCKIKKSSISLRVSVLVLYPQLCLACCECL